MTDDLAPGFQSVDRASEFALFSGCLDLIDSLPFFAECKRESYDLLGAAPGRRILEVGCGLGDDPVRFGAGRLLDAVLARLEGQEKSTRTSTRQTSSTGGSIHGYERIRPQDLCRGQRQGLRRAAHHQARVPAPARHRRARALGLRRRHAGPDPALPGPDHAPGHGRHRRLAGDDQMAAGRGQQIQGHEDPLHLRGDAAHHCRQPARQGRVHAQYRHRGGDRDRPPGAGAAEGDRRRPGPARHL